VVLSNPSFEVGKARVGKGGVVRDPVAHADALEAVITARPQHRTWLACRAGGLHRSLVRAGNHEYLLWLRPDRNRVSKVLDHSSDRFLVEGHTQVAKPSPTLPALDGRCCRVAGADADHGLNGADEDLAIAEISPVGGAAS